jgi:hypothetical protein
MNQSANQSAPQQRAQSPNASVEKTSLPDDVATKLLEVELSLLGKIGENLAQVHSLGDAKLYLELYAGFAAAMKNSIDSKRRS